MYIYCNIKLILYNNCFRGVANKNSLLVNMYIYILYFNKYICNNRKYVYKMLKL